MLSLVITGNPGVGKHTIGEELASMLDLNIIDLNSIAISEGIFDEYDESKNVDVAKLEKILEKLVDEKYLIIGHLAPYVLKDSQINRVIILRKNPYELIPVYKNRGYSEKKTRDNTESEILGVIAHDAIKRFGDKTIQIDATKKSISDITSQIKDSLDNGTKGDIVDWLSLVADKKDLERFFSYD